MMSDEPVIVFDHVSKMYHKRAGTGTVLSLIPGLRRRRSDEFWALKDVSFEVKRGECLGIIGPNGAGKSTVLKILSRVTPATSGNVRVNGRLASLIEVGAGFHPELTGRENVYLNAAILGMTKKEIDARFDEIVDFAELWDFIDVPVKRYSSGMYVRLGFAVAAHLLTEILLVDEVLAVGDAAFQKKCMGTMQQAAGEGRTVVFVSHNLASVQRLCNRAIWLAEGQAKCAGRVNEVVTSYLSTVQSVSNVLRVDYPDDPAKPMQFVTARLRKPPSRVFTMSDGLAFELDVLTRSPVPGAYVTINIMDSNDMVAYWTSDIDSARFLAPIAGLSTMTCQCPPYLLTPGRYSANFGIVCLGRGSIDHFNDKRIVFEVTDTSSLLASHGIRQPGITAVPSEWGVRSGGI